MKFGEVGFRAFYHQLNAIMMTEDIRDIINDFPDVEKANCVLTYGYIDHEAGLTLEILAAGKRRENTFTFYDGNDEISAIVRMETVENEDFFWFRDADNRLKDRYSGKIGMLKNYDVSEEIAKTRDMAFLDDSRDKFYIDDVMVYLTKKGLQPEGCWVRISGLGDHWFMGKLLNEPNQDFGYHLDETIGFFLQKTEDGKTICMTDMTPSIQLTAEDLADGTMLKNAIHVFNNERTQEHIIDVMEFLRDSLVWVPGNAFVSEEDKAAIQKAVEDAGDDLDSLVGTEFVNQKNIRIKPDILKNGDQYYFPVFSSIEEMGEYGKRFSKVQKHFLEVIPMAVANESSVSGIVVNAFTEPFVLDRGLFDMVKKMKSRIE